MGLRIIAGSARGRKLISPEGKHVRPTLDRVRESVFNMLTAYLAEASVLDLFAGSGALGIEALSRGAAHAVFVDQSKASLEVVKQNLTLTHFEPSAEVIYSDFSAYLRQCSTQFDLIFLDPPYAAGFLESALDIIHQRKLLAENGLIVCELDSTDEIVCPEAYELYRNRKYGKARILLMKEL